MARVDWSSSEDPDVLALGKALTTLLKRHAVDGSSSVAIIHVLEALQTPELSGTKISIMSVKRLEPPPARRLSVQHQPIRIELNIYERTPAVGGGQVTLDEVLASR
jgi:hypothetical protein